MKAQPVRGATATAVMAVAGLAGPIIFTAVFVGQSLFRPEYSHLADPVSALAAGPHGWLQDVNFMVFGVLMVAYAIGLHRGVLPSRWGPIGAAVLVLSGVGLVLAGVVPARDAAGAFSTNPRHFAAASLSFLGAGIGLVLLWRRMAADPRWRGLAGYALLSGIVIVVLFLATGAMAIPPDAPLHPWLGLLQRSTLAVWLPCTTVLAIRLLRVSTTLEGSRAVPAPPTTPMSTSSNSGRL